MKKFALSLCVLGVFLLLIGGALTSKSIQGYVIRSYGRIANPEQPEPEPEPESPQSTQLSQIGYLTMFSSIGFFTVAFLYNRNRRNV